MIQLATQFPSAWARARAGVYLTTALTLTALSMSSAGATAPATPPILSNEQQTRAEHLKDTLRCPICKGESINESPNDISREMRAEVDRMVAAGQTDREIYDFFSTRYGQFVLLDPPKQGANLLLWAGPLLALAAGGGWLLSTLKTRSTAPTHTEHAVAEPEHNDLRPYLERVQREAGSSLDHKGKKGKNG